MLSRESVKIFLVDDDPFYLVLCDQLLRNLGYKNLVLFENANDCIHNLGQKPGIIFLDHGLGNFNGLELMKNIKNAYPDIYVIILSAEEDNEIAANALRSGAFDYIVKGENDIEKITLALSRIEDIYKQLYTDRLNFFKRLFSFI